MAKAPIFQMGKVRPTERGWLGQGRQPVKQAAGTPYPWSARLSIASGGVEGTPNLSRPLAPAATDPTRPCPAAPCAAGKGRVSLGSPSDLAPAGHGLGCAGAGAPAHFPAAATRKARGMEGK